MPGRRSSLLLLIIACVALTLPTLAWGQEEMAPLSLTGHVGAGYSSLENEGFNAASPVLDMDADLSGYWKDPRILLFYVDPVASLGNSVATASDVANHGDGVNATTTMLGGGSFPLTVSYSQLWQQVPTYSSTGNVLSSLATSYSAHEVGIDFGIYWRRVPPISIQYATGSTTTNFPGALGDSTRTNNVFSASTFYALKQWHLDGGYSRSTAGSAVQNLADLGSGTHPENVTTEELHVEALRTFPLHTAVNVTGGRRVWDDESQTLQSNYTYDYARASANSRPYSRLGVNLYGDYLSNAGAAEAQQLLGVSGAAPVAPNSSTLTSARTEDIGGGGNFKLIRGVSAGGDATFGNSESAAGNGDTYQWDGNVNYQHNVRRSGVLTASYVYEQSDTNASPLITSNSVQTTRASFSDTVSHRLHFSGAAHYDQRTVESSSTLLGTIESPGHGYGFSVSASRPLARDWKISGDFALNDSVTDFPVHFESRIESFGVRAESAAWLLSVRRATQEGLALQVGSGLIFVNDTQSAQLTPLGAVLSQNSTAQTTLSGTYQPGKKRLFVSFAATRFDYSNRGVPTTAATTLNGLISYRLRRLRLQMGYYSTAAQVYQLNQPGTQIREIYFEVIRRFSIF